MGRLFNEPELIIATHNPGKLREIAQLFEPFGVKALSAGELGLPEPMEDGLTFTANAEVKARAADEDRHHSGKVCILDLAFGGI